VRALRCTPGEVLRFSRPLVGCDPVRVLVAVGQGQPCVLRKLARPTRAPLKEEVPAQHVPITRPVLAMMEGGSSYPSCIEQALSLRDT
jgi:hypothetical protein